LIGSSYLILNPFCSFVSLCFRSSFSLWVWFGVLRRHRTRIQCNCQFRSFLTLGEWRGKVLKCKRQGRRERNNTAHISRLSNRDLSIFTSRPRHHTLVLVLVLTLVLVLILLLRPPNTSPPHRSALATCLRVPRSSYSEHREGWT
jgi:hypothetical protein